MKLVHPHMQEIIKFEENKVNSIIIENQQFFYEFINDIYNQLSGDEGKIVLSINNEPVDISKHLEMLTSFIPFEINKKPLLNKIYSTLEEHSQSSELYIETQNIISSVSKYIMSLTDYLDCGFEQKEITATSIIKMASPTLYDEYEEPMEKIIDYMELIRQFIGDKLFVFVNIRSYYTDDKMKLFFETINSHKFNILFLESIERTRLPFEKRLVIDNDLCEF